MNFNSEDIQEFQEIYKETFGKEISIDDARKEAVKLIDLMRIVTGSLSEDSKDSSNLTANKR